MTSTIELRPGLTPIADWRAIYRGTAVTLDPVARADVEAGRAALAAILSRNGSMAPHEIGNGGPSVAELAEMHGEPLSAGLLRLFVALKLGSLAQGTAGVRWRVVERLADLLSNDLLPVVTAEHAEDGIALAQLFAVLTGTGEALRKGKVRPAQKALKKADLKPPNLNPRERRALLSGSQLSVAAALAGLFEAERVLQSAIVAAALTTAVTHDETPLHPRAHRLARQRGRIEIAAWLHQLSEGPTRSTELTNDSRRMSAATLGACFDLLRHASVILERAANAVTEDQLVLWQSEEIVEGLSDLSSVAASVDQIAQALRMLGDLSEARTKQLAGRNEPTAPEGEASPAGIESKATGFAAENRERAKPVAPDPSRIWRLLPMAGTTALVIGVEFLAAARAVEAFSIQLPAELEAVRKAVRDAAPSDETGVLAATNLASIAVLVGSGSLAAVAGVPLPSLTPPPPEKRPPPR